MTSPHRTPLHFTWHQQHSRSLTFGERAADVLRNSMGSWRFVFGFIAFMLVWAAINSFSSGWDAYPFILLNLFLSMLAGLQGAILLIAAKRQDGIAAALSQHDFDTDLTARADIEVLLDINRNQAVLLDEMCAILRRLDVELPVHGTA
ncbi:MULTISPECIES: DUF1003 domain-containing protein [unclassified Rathayibacter]|uniref:DUF1003 domain-containing protein n=1 Tax=unclassified Rathayibacter TaxID=2609250 RepID=UPI0006FAEAF6|nr:MULTISPECIES: DUF1003 domain-containing protein [unclassified Rathayibacter]KQQ01519.1 hypothetical protein ASF42_13810 [Rathayibacter sp. Leaf294]KQS11551.1 hypothetical protein ASG06_13810 [Rathayibacter sp. Leaf185]